MRTSSRSPWFALAALALAMLTIGLDATVLNVALGPLTTELGASTSGLQWITTAYTLTLGALMIPMGALGDRYGRKRILVIGLFGFATASFVCAMSPSPAVLVAGRVLLGACAAAMVPLSMAVLPSLFPAVDDRNKALGAWMAASALGLPLGPIVGGLLLQHLWWGSVFMINIPLALLGMVAVIGLVPESRGRRVRISVASVVVSALGVAATVYAFTAAGQYGWLSVHFIVSAVVAVVALTTFSVTQLHSSQPLVNLRLLRRRGFAVGTGLAAIAMIVLSGSMFQTTQLLVVAYDSDALTTGLRLLPIVGGLIIGTRVAARIAARIGARNALYVFGTAILAACATQAAVVGAGYPVTALLLALLGLGIGGVIPLSLTMAMGELDQADVGAGSALLQAIRQIGSAIGVALLGSVTVSVYRHHLDSVRLPSAVADEVRESVTAGVSTLVDSGGQALIRPIVDAYENGLALSGVVATAIAIVMIILARCVPVRSELMVDEPQWGGERIDERR